MTTVCSSQVVNFSGRGDVWNTFAFYDFSLDNLVNLDLSQLKDYVV